MPLAGGQAGDLPVQQQPPPIGMGQPGDDVQKRRLARAGGAQQSHEFARLDIQRDAFEDIGVLKGFVDVDCLEGHEWASFLGPKRVSTPRSTSVTKASAARTVAAANAPVAL